jgi:hypothetical protein
MHLTKQHWQELVDRLSEQVGRRIDEVHTKDLYNGNGVFHGIDGPDRARLITDIFAWLTERKHDLVYASIVKNSYFEAKQADRLPAELFSPWRFLGFHLVLAIQKHFQNQKQPKGHTIFVFDNQERERMRFTDLILRPPAWSDSYYGRGKHQRELDQVVDTPYFGDSRDVVLIQLADLVAFLLRRYAQLAMGLAKPKYTDEADKLSLWMESIRARRISTPIYRHRGRNEIEDLFYAHAPEPVRNL